jgi:pimeloyl-ACP methyl ester carboxylesterase
VTGDPPDNLNRVTLRRAGVTLSALVATEGSRPPVLLLHGLAGSARELRPLAAALHADGHPVVVPDQRGHGRSTRRPADLSRAAYVADAAAFLTRPAVVIGQSMGAHTAMLTAAAHPEPTLGLVMIEGGVGGSTEDYPARLGAWFAGWPVPFADLAAARAYLGERSPFPADLERGPDGLRPRFDADVMEAAIRAVADTARWPEWESLSGPALLIQGGSGTMAAAEVKRMLERPAVSHALVAGAGHDVHLDAPAETLALIRDFIARLPR